MLFTPFLLSLSHNASLPFVFQIFSHYRILILCSKKKNQLIYRSVSFLPKFFLFCQFLSFKHVILFFYLPPYSLSSLQVSNRFYSLPHSFLDRHHMFPSIVSLLAHSLSIPFLYYLMFFFRIFFYRLSSRPPFFLNFPSSFSICIEVSLHPTDPFYILMHHLLQLFAPHCQTEERI